jgi:hypothetical protein
MEEDKIIISIIRQARGKDLLQNQDGPRQNVRGKYTKTRVCITVSTGLREASREEIQEEASAPKDDGHED